MVSSAQSYSIAINQACYQQLRFLYGFLDYGRARKEYCRYSCSTDAVTRIDFHTQRMCLPWREDNNGNNLAESSQLHYLMTSALNHLQYSNVFAPSPSARNDGILFSDPKRCLRVIVQNQPSIHTNGTLSSLSKSANCVALVQSTCKSLSCQSYHHSPHCGLHQSPASLLALPEKLEEPARGRVI